MASLPRPPAAHALWEKGVNSAGGSMRSLRILMPVGMAIDILEHADMSVFVDAAGAVECPLDQLQAPDHRVYVLKDEPQEMWARARLWSCR